MRGRHANEYGGAQDRLIGIRRKLSETFQSLSWYANDEEMISLIRLVLVPAIMQLMGGLNWWLPAALHGLAGQGATFGVGEPVPAFAEELELAA